jgi:rod shape determining protein RodA
MASLLRKGVRSVDHLTLALYFALVALGCLMVYTATRGELNSMHFFQSSAGKQIIWTGVSLLIFLGINLSDWKFWRAFAYLLYTIGIALLILVLFFGVTVKGSTSWFSFGGAFSFQPAEIAKFTTCVGLAAYLSAYDTRLDSLQGQALAFGLILLPAGVIMLQPDPGSALVFLAFLAPLYREGLSPDYFMSGFFLAAVFIAGFVFGPEYVTLFMLLTALFVLAYHFRNDRVRWLIVVSVFSIIAIYLFQQEIIGPVLIAAGVFFGALALALWRMERIRNRARVARLLLAALLAGSALTFGSDYVVDNMLKPHQQDRINVWLRPHLCDARGSLYNVVQSKMAISSGGFFGKGVFNGDMTRLNYVPEQSTDFIFCTIGEEQGFVGSAAIIAIFFLLLYRITMLAERQRSTFSRAYAYGVAGLIFVHFAINIGMTMGLVPIIGIPLPFVSKGGSSLLGFSMMIALLVKLDRHRYQI